MKRIIKKRKGRTPEETGLGAILARDKGIK
jgi:hypothetical protein